MKTKIFKLETKLLLITLVAGLVQSAYSDGYRNPPPTAEGIGKSGANAVFVDDASAISYNPANLALQDKSSIVVSAVFAKTDNTFFNPLNPAGAVDSDNDWAVLPNLYASIPIGSNGLVVGLGITTPYGQGIKWAPTDVFNPAAPPASIYEAQIALINFNPTVAFRVGESIAIGVGLDLMYSELEFNALTTGGGPPTGAAEAEGDGVGVGGNLGLTWLISESQRAIITYRSEVEIDYEGSLSTVGAPLVSSSFGLGVTFPNTVSLGYGIQITDDIKVEADIEWLEWSSTQSLNADLGVNGPLVIPQNWEDTITIGLGGDWQVSDSWIVRAGYAFIETPVPDATISPILPDADRHAISFGLGYMLGSHLFDIAYTYSIYDDRSSPSGTYEIDSNLIGLTYSFAY